MAEHRDKKCTCVNSQLFAKIHFAKPVQGRYALSNSIRLPLPHESRSHDGCTEGNGIPRGAANQDGCQKGEGFPHFFLFFANAEACNASRWAVALRE